MPVQHRGKQRVPVDLEPTLMAHVELISDRYNVPRTKLIRIFIKYGMNNIEEAIKQGDSLVWTEPKPNTKSKVIGDKPNTTNDFGDDVQTVNDMNG